MTHGKKAAAVSRFVLYGMDTPRRKATVQSWAIGKAQNMLRERVGLHSVSAPGIADFLQHYLTQWAAKRWNKDNQSKLPKGWPRDVWETIDKMVKARGGSVKLAEDLVAPCFKLNAKTALAIDTMWIAYVDFENDSCDFGKLIATEDAIEDAISRKCNKMLNVRILSKPARIEVDNPAPPTFLLKDRWPLLLNGTTPKHHYALGVQSKPTGNVLQVASLTDSNEFSLALFGASGSGKTQALLAALLSVCATTSPDELAVILIDPKGLDFPVDTLPHLACPVINDASEACDAILALAKELDRRAKAKKRENMQKRILLVSDELADLLQVQKGNELEAALLRLAQMGRALGFSLFLGSQRAVNESFPRNIHAQIPARWVGRVLNKAEAGFAAGPPSDAHRLPGRGAFMLYAPGIEGLRMQSLFVADAKDPHYERDVNQFVTDICDKWEGVKPHWTWNGSTEDDDDDGIDLGDQLMMALSAEAEKGKLTQYKVRKLHKEIFKTDPGAEKAKLLLEKATSVV